MPKLNHDLVSTKITRATKNQLEFIKSQYRLDNAPLATGDYTAIAYLVEQEHKRCLVALSAQG